MSRKRKEKRASKKADTAVPQEVDVLAEGSGPNEVVEADAQSLADAASDALGPQPEEELEAAAVAEEPAPKKRGRKSKKATDAWGQPIEIDADEAAASPVEVAVAVAEEVPELEELEVANDPSEPTEEQQSEQSLEDAVMRAEAEAELGEGEEPGGDVEEIVAADVEGGAALPTTAASMEQAQLKNLVEALVFAADKPVTLLRLRQLTRVSDVKRLEQALADIAADYTNRGVALQQVSGGYQFRTNTSYSVWVQQLIAGRPVRLSRAQLETLAIVAYRQPITRPEVDEIRGVDSSATLRLLLDRSLIRVLGKKEDVGRPTLYGTTKEFLDFFSLGDLRELPTLREYSELTAESRKVISDRLGIDPEGNVVTAAGEAAADSSGDVAAGEGSGSVGASDAVDARGSVDASESVEPADAVDASDAAEASESLETSESVEMAAAVDGNDVEVSDSAEASDSVEARGSVEASDSGDASNSLEASESVEAADAVDASGDASDSLEANEPGDASEALEASESGDANDSLETSESGDANDSLEASESGGTRGSIEASDTVGAADAVDASDSLDASDAREASDSVETAAAGDANDAVEASDSLEASDSVETAAAVGGDAVARDSDEASGSVEARGSVEASDSAEANESVDVGGTAEAAVHAAAIESAVETGVAPANTHVGDYDDDDAAAIAAVSAVTGVIGIVDADGSVVRVGKGAARRDSNTNRGAGGQGADVEDRWDAADAEADSDADADPDAGDSDDGNLNSAQMASSLDQGTPRGAPQADVIGAAGGAKGAPDLADIPEELRTPADEDPSLDARRPYGAGDDSEDPSDEDNEAAAEVIDASAPDSLDETDEPPAD